MWGGRKQYPPKRTAGQCVRMSAAITSSSPDRGSSLMLGPADTVAQLPYSRFGLVLADPFFIWAESKERSPSKNSGEEVRGVTKG